MSAQRIVDWEAIFDQLRRGGITTTALARELSIPRTTLLDYANHGMRPKYEEGERIIRYWANLTNSTIAQVPYQQNQLNGNQRRSLY